MPGMNSGVSDNNPIMVAAFRTALLHQGLIALLILVTLALTWASIREWLPGLVTKRAAQAPEPMGRHLARVGFGLLWIFDGILQAQPAMAAGLPNKVMAPAAATSPTWVQHLVNWAGTAWSFHPVQAGASAVWIQVGIGVWLLCASHGRWSRAAGLASVVWGMAVWIFGEAFGGIFAPGLTVLFGAPGAVLFYVVAGALIALPDRLWHGRVLGQWVLTGIGVFLAGMTLLQAWPGRGFWQGTAAGHQGSLTSMISSMSGTAQPRLLANWIAAFASFTARHGFAVNLFAVVVLAAIAGALLSRRPRLITPALIALAVFGLADWLLVEDLGFLGGVGTDPNSMIPLLLVAFTGYVAMTRPAPTAEAAEIPQPAASGNAVSASAVPVHATVAAGQQAAHGDVPVSAAATALPGSGTPADGHAASDPGMSLPADAIAVVGGQGADQPGSPLGRLTEQARPARLAGVFGSARMPAVVAGWGAALILLGATPMALAQTNHNADPIIAQSLSGSAEPQDYPAPGFTLTDQRGHHVSLAGLRGKVVILTFLDPICWTDCPVIAQELKATDRILGAKAANVQVVAVVANRVRYQPSYVSAFDRHQQMNGVRNWLYLTGSLRQLQTVWLDYGIIVLQPTGGGMSVHSDTAFIIDPTGHVRTVFGDDPGPGTQSSRSSFAVLFTQFAEQAMTR